MDCSLFERNSTKDFSMTLQLISRLIQSLEEESISYCHWKSNAAIEETLSGTNDLDLLVASEDKQRFISVLSRLNFIRAFSPMESWFPSICHYYGHDVITGEIVHIHLHDELILGFDLIKNYHIPIENIFLQSATGSGGLRTPPCELDLIVFVIRMVLKRRLLSFVLGHPKYLLKTLLGKGREGLSKSDQNDFNYLRRNIDTEKLKEYHRQYFPFLSVQLFQHCMNSLSSSSKPFAWLVAGYRLASVLKPYRRHSLVATVVLSIYRCFMMKLKAVLHLLRLRTPERKRPEHGGKIIAFVGGDGAGKTTNISKVESWLGRYFDVRTIKVGRPLKGVLWYLMLVLLTIRQLVLRKAKDNFRQSVIYWLIARYRYLAFCRAVRLRSQGVIVCLDRIPLPELKHMDTPRIRDLTGGVQIYRFLAHMEEEYYARIRGADELIVLRLDPKIAARRRPCDDQKELAERSGEIWSKKWSKRDINIIDTGQPLDEVNGEIRNVVWSSLQKSPKIVEMIGPAGSGKTTIAKKLLDETFDVQTSISWQDDKLQCLKSCLYKFPDIVSLMLRRVPLVCIEIMLSIEIRLAVLQKHKKRHFLPCRVLVLDQGPLLQLTTLKLAYIKKYSVSNEITWLTALEAETTRTLDIVIWLDAGIETLQDRINRREQTHRMKGRSKEVMAQFFEDYRACFAEATRNGGSRILIKRIDTTQMSIDDVVAAIRHFV